ncbi:hypothetical protein ACJX0J_026003 [Zea mays]
MIAWRLQIIKELFFYHTAFRWVAALTRQPMKSCVYVCQNLLITCIPFWLLVGVAAGIVILLLIIAENPTIMVVNYNANIGTFAKLKYMKPIYTDSKGVWLVKQVTSHNTQRHVWHDYPCLSLYSTFTANLLLHICAFLMHISWWNPQI